MLESNRRSPAMYTTVRPCGVSATKTAAGRSLYNNLAAGSGVDGLADRWLEALCVVLVAAACRKDEAWVQDTLTKPGQPRRELDKLLTAVDIDDAFHDPVTAFAQDVARYLDGRNTLVHSVVVLQLDQLDSPGQGWGLWQPRTDTVSVLDLSQMRELTDRLKALAGRALTLFDSAYEWNGGG